MDVKFTNISIGQFGEEVVSGFIDIAKLNRPFEWKNDVPLKFASTLLDGILATPIILWEQNRNVEHDITHYINMQELRHDIKMAILRALLIDGGHRAACLYAWLTGNLINIGNGDFAGRNKNIGIAFNPRTAEFKYINTLNNKEKNEFIFPMREVWKDLVDVDDEVYEERAVDIIKKYYSKAGINTVLMPISEDEQLTISRNVKKLVRIPKKTIGVGTIPARATLDQISNTFIETNAGEDVSITRKLLSRMVVKLPEISDRYVDFYESNFDPFLLNSQENLPSLAVTVLTHKGGKDSKAYESVMSSEKLPEFESVSETLLNETYFKDFNRYISASFGINGKINAPSSKKQALHITQSIYYKGLHSFPDINKNRFREVIRKLYFSLVIMPRCFKDNYTDQTKKFFSNKLKDITYSDKYIDYVLDFSTNFVFNANMDVYKPYLVKPTFDKNDEAKDANQHPFVKVQRSILYYENAIVPFLTNSKFANFQDCIVGDHIYPKGGSYIFKDLSILESPMNIMSIHYESNGSIGNQKPSGYFEIELKKRHTDEEIAALIKQQRLDLGYEWWKVEPDEEFLLKFYDDRANVWMDSLKDFYHNTL